MAHDAMFELGQKLRKAGCTEEEIDKLLSKFLEEEARDYVNMMDKLQNIKPDDLEKLVQEINDMKNKHMS